MPMAMLSVQDLAAAAEQVEGGTSEGDDGAWGGRRRRERRGPRASRAAGAEAWERAATGRRTMGREGAR